MSDPAIDLSLIKFDSISLYASRVEEGTPRSFRLAHYPGGELVLQGAFFWHQGGDGGVEWRTIPTVELDEFGVEK